MTALLNPLLGDVHDSLWFPKSASSFSDQVDSTYHLVLGICYFFLIPITILIVYFMFRYRKPRGARAESQVSHNTKLELTWSILPSVLLVWIFIKGAVGFIDQRSIPEGATELSLSAFKWNWAVDYGGGMISPELHVVKDQPTKLVMRSQDVIHSFFVPAFRVKRDVVPNRYHEIWFKPTVATGKVSDEELAEAKRDAEENHGGVFNPNLYHFTAEGYRFYDLYCAEYCGTDHSKMQTQVVVHETQEELDAWIKKNSGRGEGQSREEYGKLLYERRGCGSCHSVDGAARVGPTFQGMFGSERRFVDGAAVVADANYVRESILDPKAHVVEGFSPVMPSYKGQLSDDDVDSLVAYLRSLGSGN